MKRDKFGQPEGEWTEKQLKILVILEEVSTESMNPDKSLMAYVVDIEEVIASYDQPKPLDGPHSRACGWQKHDHGPACHHNCPTCGGKR